MKRLIPWFLRALWNPDIELDLRDSHGAPDHGKVIGAFAFICDVLLIVTGHLPPLGHFIALNSVVFGWLGWRTFLKSKSATSREQLETRVEHRSGEGWVPEVDVDFVAHEWNDGQEDGIV